MESLRIEPSKSSPEVHFDAETGLLRIRGESFPENAAKFYTPVMDWLTRYFAEPSSSAAVLELEIIYFNSSTSKILMNIFQMAERAAASGRPISARWLCDEENETAIECGEEFKEDLSSLPFDIVVAAAK
jgi:hypothetical protein